MEGCVSNTQHEKAMLILKTALFLLVHGFQGTNSLWTVSKVAVQAGGSVTIPCHYHRMFQQRMKYWCKGRRWNVCRELGRTTSKPRTEGFSITDYPSEQFFTITMTNLQEKDTDRYWCAVKRSAWDSVRASMEVEVTEDPPDLSVRENMVSVEEGANATITCSYTDRLKSSEKMWCESGDLLSCKSGLTSTTSQEPSFTIADDGSGVFNVTVVKLQRKHTGWYWCSAGGLQAPVHINVTRRPDELINITATTQSVLSVSSPVSSAQTPHTIFSISPSHSTSTSHMATSVNPESTPSSKVTFSPQVYLSSTPVGTTIIPMDSTTHAMAASVVPSTEAVSPRTSGATPGTHLSSAAPTMGSVTTLYSPTASSNNTDSAETQHSALVWRSVVISIGVVMLLISVGVCSVNLWHHQRKSENIVALDDMMEHFALDDDEDISKDWPQSCLLYPSEEPDQAPDQAL